ncbi:unnamed protein product, partial [Iphiclides podalirius]
MNKIDRCTYPDGMELHLKKSINPVEVSRWRALVGFLSEPVFRGAHARPGACDVTRRSRGAAPVPATARPTTRLSRLVAS